MRALVRLAARLYPAPWRRRYLVEFEALLEDTDLGWRDLLDVIRGAMKMHVRTTSIWKFALAAGVLCAIAALLTFWREPPVYVSNATVRVRSLHPNDFLADVMSRRTLSGIITRLGLYRSERTEQPLEDIIETMRQRDIEYRWVTREEFAISYKNSDPELARQGAKALTEAVLAIEDRQFLIAIVAPANLPQSPIENVRLKMAGFGFAGGFCAFLLAVGVRRWPLPAAAGVAGFLISGLFSFLLPDRYVSYGLLRAYTPAQICRVEALNTDEAFLRHVLTRDRPWQEVQALTGLPKVTKRERNGRNSAVFRVQFQGPDPASAQKAVSSTMVGLLSRQLSVSYEEKYLLPGTYERKEADPATANGALDVVESATLPMSPSAPDRLLIAQVGGLVSILLAVGLLPTRRLRSLRRIPIV